MYKTKGILLDIDNLLYDYDKSHRIALDCVFTALVKKYPVTKDGLVPLYEKVKSEIHLKLKATAASHNRILYFQRMLEELGINSLLHTLEYYNLYWDTFLDNLTVFDGVYSFLDSVKQKKICFLSDLTANIQHRKARKMKLFNYAQFLVTSEEAGKEKPHPDIFLLALAKLKLNTSEVCMIGDDYKKDIIGATKLGIRSFWFNKENQVRKKDRLVVEFKSFKDLKFYPK